jgi:hypothetical protein
MSGESATLIGQAEWAVTEAEAALTRIRGDYEGRDHGRGLGGVPGRTHRDTGGGRP